MSLGCEIICKKMKILKFTIINKIKNNHLPVTLKKKGMINKNSKNINFGILIFNIFSWKNVVRFYKKDIEKNPIILLMHRTKICLSDISHIYIHHISKSHIYGMDGEMIASLSNRTC